MAESSYTESASKAAPRYDDSNPNYSNDAYSQMFQGESAYDNQNKTGFRQSIPKALSDTYYEIPEYKIGTIDYTKPEEVKKERLPIPTVTEGGEHENNSSQVANNNTLSYLNDYNNSINTFGSEGMTQANITNPVANPTDFYGNPISKQINSPTFNPLDFVPGFGLMNTLTGDAVPSKGYGAPGTYSGITGNKFDASGRAYNPITGQYKDEYASKKAWGSKMIDDPFGNLFGDSDKAAQGELSDLEYSAHRSELSELPYGAVDNMGNPVSVGLSKKNEAKVIMQYGLDMGFPAHTVAPGTPTFESIKTGRYHKGSQFFPSKKNKPKVKDYTVTKGPLDTSNINIDDITTDYGRGGSKDFSDINSKNSLNQNVSINTDTSNNNAADDAADAAQAAANAAVNQANQDNNNGGQDEHGNDNNTGGGGSNDYGGMFSSGGKIPPLTYATEGKYIGQPTGKQTIVGKDIYSSPITGPMGNLVGGKNASEQGTTIKKDNQYGNIPSIYDGRQYNENQLFEMMRDKTGPQGNPASYGIPNPNAYYNDPKIATVASIMRSRALDGQNVMSMEHFQRDPFEDIFRSTK